MRRLIHAAPIRELSDLGEVAERRLTGIGAKLRANLVPPLLRAGLRRNRAHWRADLVAGLPIAALTIPQAVAFALLIGIPVPAVLGSAIVGAVLCALYCSSRHLVFGPTNTISIILAGALLALADQPLDPLQKVLLIGFVMGAVQLAAGLGSLGQITQFVSRAVIVGYSTAVGLLIAAGQLANLIGIERGPSVSLPGTLRHLAASIATLQLNTLTAVIGLTGLLVIIWLHRWRPHWPDGLLMLVAAGLASWVFDFGTRGVHLVRDLGTLSGGVPLFTGFPLNASGLALLPEVTSVAIAAAILGMLEAVTIAKSLATRSGQRIDPDQELIGMGLGNLVGAGFGAMPGSASFLRSATGQQAGAVSQWAVVFGSGYVLLLVVVLAPLLAYIPIAAIAAYLIMIAVRLIQPAQIFIVRNSTRSDAMVFWLTLCAALFLDLDTAIFTGIGLSLVLFLQKAGTPSLTEHAFDDQGQLTQIDASTERNNPQVAIVHVEGDLFFGAADLFQDGVRRLAEDPATRVFILRMKNARHLDATTVMALGQLVDFLRSQDRHLLVSGVHGDVARVLKRSGLAARIGLENLFPAEENPTLATKKALVRAQELIGIKPELRVFYQQNTTS
jgi:SulP family sulfate permease